VPSGQVEGQSAAQLAGVSFGSQVPLGQHEPQSAGHDEQISPPLHTSSPHITPPVVVTVEVEVLGPGPSPPIDEVIAPPLPLPPLPPLLLVGGPLPVLAPPSSANVWLPSAQPPSANVAIPTQ